MATRYTETVDGAVYICAVINSKTVRAQLETVRKQAIVQYPMTRIGVTAGFGPYTVSGVRKPHNGTDICWQANTNVVAAHTGVCIMSVYDSAGGNMLALQGPYNEQYDIITRYAHLSSRKINKGEIVQRGQIIGIQGKTGSACFGQHLHFETWLVPAGYAYSYADRARYAIDPLSLCHVVAGQTFVKDADTYNCDGMPYPEPLVDKLTPCGAGAKLRVANGNVRVRMVPYTNYTPLIKGSSDRSVDTLGEWWPERGGFDALYTCETTTGGATERWVLIDTSMGRWYTALLDGMTSLDDPGSGATETDTPTTFDGAEAVDISTYQDTVDMAQVKASGIHAAIIRAGFRGYGTGKLVRDTKLASHLKGAIAADLHNSLYVFSQAVTEAEAAEEANFCCDISEEYGGGRAYPIVIDSEYATSDGSGRADGLTAAQRTDVIAAFCRRCIARGYLPMIYASKSWFASNLILSRLTQYELWVAHYTSAPHPEYKATYGMWQYTSSGAVPGISGRVDLNHVYKDYPSIIKSQGLNGFEAQPVDPADPSDPDEPITPAEPEQPTGDVTLIVGPMSGGDYANIKRRAGELGLHVDEPGGGVLTLGPMSAAARADIEALAAQLGNIDVKIVDNEPEQPTDDKTAQIAKLSEEVAELRIKIDALSGENAKYRAAKESILASLAELD